MASFRPGAIWCDNNGVHINAHGAGILECNGMYYWFGEHKVAGVAGNTAQVGVHCYSSSDLYHWRDEGIALAVSSDPASEITRGCILERPRVVYNVLTQKYVMWFHLEFLGRGYSTARWGVAMSDSVAGPYTFLKSLRPDAGVWPRNVLPAHQEPVHLDQLRAHTFGGGEDPNIADFNLVGRDQISGQDSRDLTLFVDDDRQAYLVYASEENSTLHVSRLTEDYLACSGDYVRVFPGRYMEAPAVCKRRGRYYFIGSGCTGWSANAARSAVAESIWGPWRELGNPCRGTGCEFTFGGQSTFILPISSGPETYIAMFDFWRPENAITAGTSGYPSSLNPIA